MANSHFEVLGPVAQQMPRRPSPLRWLLRRRLVILLLAVVVAVLLRDTILGESGPGSGADQPLIAVVKGLSWESAAELPRQVEVELTSTTRPVSALRLRLNGRGVSPGVETAYDRELVPGATATVRFGVGSPYCVTGDAALVLEGSIFDTAGAAHSVQLPVEDPDRLFEQVNSLACFDDPLLVRTEVDVASAKLITTADDPSLSFAVVRLPVDVHNDGSLPLLLTQLQVNERTDWTLRVIAPAGGSVAVQVEFEPCIVGGPIVAIALLAEDFGGSGPAQLVLDIDDQLRALLDEATLSC